MRGFPARAGVLIALAAAAQTQGAPNITSHSCPALKPAGAPPCPRADGEASCSRRNYCCWDAVDRSCYAAEIVPFEGLACNATWFASSACNCGTGIQGATVVIKAPGFIEALNNSLTCHGCSAAGIATTFGKDLFLHRYTMTLRGTATIATYAAAIASVAFIQQSSRGGQCTYPITLSYNFGHGAYRGDLGGHFYERVSPYGFPAPACSSLADGSCTWSTAQRYCADPSNDLLGLVGYLPTYATEDEKEMVGSLTQEAGWIGRADVAKEGEWRWVTGPEGCPGTYDVSASDAFLRSGCDLDLRVADKDPCWGRDCGKGTLVGVQPGDQTNGYVPDTFVVAPGQVPWDTRGSQQPFDGWSNTSGPSLLGKDYGAVAGYADIDRRHSPRGSSRENYMVFVCEWGGVGDLCMTAAAVAATTVLVLDDTCPDVDECTGRCNTCAESKCSSATQECDDPNKAGWSLRDWKCVCVGESGEKRGSPAMCFPSLTPLDECEESCLSCEGDECSAAGQVCVDPKPNNGSLSDWLCRCPAHVSVFSDTVRRVAECRYDECDFGLGVAAVCERATPPQTCNDPDVSVLGDWTCTCRTSIRPTTAAVSPCTLVPLTSAPPTAAPPTAAPPSPPTPLPATLTPPTQLPLTFIPPTVAPPTEAPPTPPTPILHTPAPPTSILHTPAPPTPAPQTPLSISPAPATLAPLTDSPMPVRITVEPATAVDPGTAQPSTSPLQPSSSAPEQQASPMPDPSPPPGPHAVAEAAQVASAGVAMLAAVTGTPGPAMRWVVTAGDCVPHGGSRDARYVMLLAPLQLELEGSRAMGAVIGNLFLLMLGGLAGGFVVATCGVGSPVGLRIPSIPLQIFYTLYQGTTVAGMDLIMNGGSAVFFTVGIASVALCIAVPAVVFRIVIRNVPANALVVHDPEAQGRVATFFLGKGEWVSNGSGSLATRLSSVVYRFRSEYAWYGLIECVASLAISGIESLRPDTWQGCGHVKTAGALCFVGLLALEVIHWPHLRARDSMLDVCLLGMQGAALILMACGYYLEDVEHFVFDMVSGLMSACVALLALQTLCTVIDQGWAWRTGRVERLQKAVLGNVPCLEDAAVLVEADDEVLSTGSFDRSTAFPAGAESTSSLADSSAMRRSAPLRFGRGDTSLHLKGMPRSASRSARSISTSPDASSPRLRPLALGRHRSNHSGSPSCRRLNLSGYSRYPNDGEDTSGPRPPKRNTSAFSPLSPPLISNP